MNDIEDILKNFKYMIQTIKNSILKDFEKFGKIVT